MGHVFVSYVREDHNTVDQLARDLRRSGVTVWLDREQISAGQRWQLAIRTAIRDGAFFLACFSESYERKMRSYMNEELTIAIEELRQRPVNRTWFIPVLLTPCSIPERPIGAGESLRDFQWIELFEDWQRGVERIIDVLLSSDLTLRSSRGISYTRLAQLLSQRQWVDADQETADKILEICGKNVLDIEDISQLPCEDLGLIDGLWVRHSGGHFGFSVQAELWASMERHRRIESNEELLVRNNEFADVIGWRREGEWLFKNDHIALTWNLSAPRGHLPGALIPVYLKINAEGEKAVGWMWWMGFCFNVFFTRVLSCGISTPTGSPTRA
jgi:hypothetical protein